jgi:rhamnogalacturonan endolyase
MLLIAFLCSFLLWPSVVLAAFGYTDDGTNYVIDSGAKLVIKVNKSTGDIASMLYGGVEYNGYDGKNTQVESGLGASTVTIQEFSSPAYIIKVTVVHGTLVHYIFVRCQYYNVLHFSSVCRVNGNPTRRNDVWRLSIIRQTPEFDITNSWL